MEHLGLISSTVSSVITLWINLRPAATDSELCPPRGCETGWRAVSCAHRDATRRRTMSPSCELQTTRTSHACVSARHSTANVCIQVLGHSHLQRFPLESRKQSLICEARTTAVNHRHKLGLVKSWISCHHGTLKTLKPASAVSVTWLHRRPNSKLCPQSWSIWPSSSKRNESPKYSPGSTHALCLGRQAKSLVNDVRTPVACDHRQTHNCDGELCGLG